MNLPDAIDRMSKPPAVGARWDARDCEAGRTLVSTIAALKQRVAELEREQEEHAQLQVRCFEGFPSASDGVFDALKEANERIATLTNELEAMKNGRVK